MHEQSPGIRGCGRDADIGEILAVPELRQAALLRTVTGGDELRRIWDEQVRKEKKDRDAVPYSLSIYLRGSGVLKTKDEHEKNSRVRVTIHGLTDSHLKALLRGCL